MTQTDLVLFAAIALIVLTSATYVVQRYRRTVRDARDREQRRSFALLAEVRGASAGVTDVRSDAETARIRSVATDDSFTTSARALAVALRCAADQVDRLVGDPGRPAHERSAAVLAVVAEATSPAVLDPVRAGAGPSYGAPG